MGNWTEDIQNAIYYIETHLTEALDMREIAKHAYVSPFYFQRIFAALCGIGAGEYIRNRRLTLAGKELLESDQRIIDIAMKYGYESPDSFNRAFQRFHGVSPSAARKNKKALHSFAPIQIHLPLEGDTMLEYTIAEKAQFTVVGLSRMFNSDTSYQEIPDFWNETMSLENCPVMGMYGICIDSEDGEKEFEYLIADNYLPWKEIPEGCVVKVIPASTWAIFPCRGPLPKALQDVNTKMWTEWLPSCKTHRLAGNYSIEMYAPPAEKEEDTYSEIWLPVEKIG